VTENLKGYKAVILGGALGEGVDRQVHATLIPVMEFLKEKKVPILGYVEGPCAAIDAEGNLYWTVPGEPNLNGYKKK
jgi:hypothetical protein